ncbi:MAG: hypothetical protein KAQ65_03020 [Candidatus Thorarchaeota archaeon]|nr:hypothetical protein [Candidatus Thorarchaeota archaeon]
MGNKDSYIKHTCSFCMKTYLYSGINNDGSLFCQHCGKIFYPHSSIEPQEESVPDTTTWLTTKRSEGVRITCPECNATYIFRDDRLAGKDKIQCQNCAASIAASGENTIIVEETEFGDESVRGDFLTIILVLIIFLYVPWIFSLPIIMCILYARISRRRNAHVVKDQGVSLGW